MPRKRSKSSSTLAALLVVLAIALWAFDAYKQSGPSHLPPSQAPPTTRDNSRATIPKSSGTTSPSRSGIYETYRNCALVSHHSNDGDSFKVKFPDGRIETVRLFFVDAPESDFRTYRSGENNHQRISEQARELENITPQQAVAIGKQAKEFTLDLLGQNPFTVHTEWDSPFHDQRYSAFVELNTGGKKRYLHELLVEQGFVRIHTRGALLPDGTSEQKQENHLYVLQRTAKARKVGVWSLK